MALYGLKGFRHEWESIYQLDGENRRHLFTAWEQIWRAYADEPTVLGFDLLNEPFRQRGGPEPRAYEDVVRNSLVPLYTALIQKMVSICPGKWAIYQPLLVDIPDRKNHPLPCFPIQMPRVHDRMIFAPHGYFETAARHQAAVVRHQDEVKSSGAALMMGEWGRQTYVANDSDLAAQLAYTKLYIEVATVFDEAGMGMIKPWFTGSRGAKRDAKAFTWAIFSDSTPTGTAERKYIMDVICRPYPLVMAGIAVERYGYTFTTRTFNMTLTRSELPPGQSEIYVPEDRHYPDGFTVVYSDRLWLARDRQSRSGLKVLKTATGLDENAFTYDAETQRLLVTRWISETAENTLRIIPGLKYRE